MHNCRLTSKAIYPPLDGEEFLFLCSRCSKCYVCRHKFVYFDDAGKWMVKCKDKFREVILDGKLKETK
jgi:hypothetical protein